MSLEFEQAEINPTYCVVVLTGETVVVLAKVHNASSSNMTPKVSLYQDVVYITPHSKKQQRTTIFKVADSCINGTTQKDVKWAIKLPHDLTQTIQNCDIIKLGYYVKVGNGVTVDLSVA